MTSMTLVQGKTITRPLLAFVVGVFAVLSGFYVRAETPLAVRDAGTSESEFLALALAHGIAPFSEVAMTDAGILLSEKDKDEFTLRLSEAQAEWLNASIGNSSANSLANSPMVAIDRFLKLETSADWTRPERAAFETFNMRKSQVGAAVSGVVTQSPESDRSKNKTLAASFIIPDDIVAILVGGAPISRSQIKSFDFGDKVRRVTFISNLYQPMTLLMTGQETEWPEHRRELWIETEKDSNGERKEQGHSCKIASPTRVSKDWNLKILSADQCANFDFGQSLDHGLRLNRRQGLGNSSEPSAFNAAIEAASTWNEASEKSSSMLIEKPWFWGVLGAVALGAVIAIEQSQRRGGDSPVPQTAARDAW